MKGDNGRRPRNGLLQIRNAAGVTRVTKGDNRGASHPPSKGDTVTVPYIGTVTLAGLSPLASAAVAYGLPLIGECYAHGHPMPHRQRPASVSGRWVCDGCHPLDVTM